MLKESNRLKSDKDFRNAFRNGKILENQFIRIKFLKSQKSISRFGFIISNRVLHKAHERNSLKRRLRAICQSLVKDLKPSFDIVFWPKASSAALRHSDLVESVKDLIIKIR